MSILKKLQTIQEKISVGKGKYNAFAEFKYRSCEDILQALKPFLAEQKCVITLNDELVEVGGKVYIKAVATLIDVETNEERSAHAYAQEPPKAKPKMDESQTTGSTSSYARKYALSGLLALDDNADSDVTNNGKKDAKKETKLITTKQIEDLKKLGFDDARLEKMAKYYKVEKVEQISYKDAETSINKQKRTLEKQKTASGGEIHE